MVNIYLYKDYHKYLKAKSEKEGQWGVVSKWAEAAGCQRSYMSNILAGKSHLTNDQAHCLSEALEHTPKEREYFLLLIEYSKASTKKYREHLDEQIKNLKMEWAVQQRADKPTFDADSSRSSYHSIWWYVGVHIATSIPDYRTSASIASALHLPIDLVEIVLGDLLSWGLVAKNNNLYEWASGETHTPRNSPLIKMKLGSWRQKATDLALMRPKNDIYYTGIYSISHKDYVELKNKFRDVINKYDTQCSKSGTETLVCMNLDFFALTKVIEN